MTLEFFGSSDDSFCWLDKVNNRADEVGAYERAAAFRVTDESGAGLFVVGQYNPPVEGADVGCWMIGVMPLDEDVPMPDWPVAPFVNRGCSPVLAITVPDYAKVESWKERTETTPGWSS